MRIRYKYKRLILTAYTLVWVAVLWPVKVVPSTKALPVTEFPVRQDPKPIQISIKRLEAQIEATADPTPPKPPPEPPKPVVRPVRALRRGAVDGTGYSAGYCTSWSAQRRAEVGKPIPGSWHNANKWLYHAKAEGFTVSPVPIQYAVGAKGMHVVFAERINPDGTVLISEKNYKGWNVVSHRTVAPTAFTWIL